MKNHYKTLGIPDFSELVDVKARFKSLARSLHSDKEEYGSAKARQADEELQVYSEAYNAIKTPAKKDAYDKDLKHHPKLHQPVADQVHGTTGSGQGRAAWTEAKPNAAPTSNTTTAEPRAQQQPPEPQPPEPPPTVEPISEEDAKTVMMRKRVEAAYGWEDDDDDPTVDVRL